jgi:hypothetical protein
MGILSLQRRFFERAYTSDVDEIVALRASAAKKVAKHSGVPAEHFNVFVDYVKDPFKFFLVHANFTSAEAGKSQTEERSFFLLFHKFKSLPRRNLRRAKAVRETALIRRR